MQDINEETRRVRAHEMLMKLAKKYPQANWIWAGQNDKADLRNEQRDDASLQGSAT